MPRGHTHVSVALVIRIASEQLSTFYRPMSAVITNSNILKFWHLMLFLASNIELFQIYLMYVLQLNFFVKQECPTGNAKEIRL